MNKIPGLFVIVTLGAFVSGAAAETIGCQDCNPKAQDDSHRERIKADRAQYDRENEKVTARPWDAVKDAPPLAETIVRGRHQ